MTKKQIRDLQEFAVELAREGNTEAAKEVLALINKAAWIMELILALLPLVFTYLVVTEFWNYDPPHCTPTPTIWSTT